ncbi:MAG: rhodanese-like domain-containing protein [Ilumatobacteraceae bacterium]
MTLRCRSGNRSGQAAEYLFGVGFADVVILDDCVLAPQPVVDH